MLSHRYIRESLMTFDWLVVVNRFVLFVVNRQAMLHIDGMLIYLFVCCLVDSECVVITPFKHLFMWLTFHQSLQVKPNLSEAHIWQ